MTVTAGGIQANESVVINSAALYRRPADVERGQRKDLVDQRPVAYGHQRHDDHRRGQRHDRRGDRRRRHRRSPRRRKPGGLISGRNRHGVEQHGDLDRGLANFGGDITVNTGTLVLNPSVTVQYSGGTLSARARCRSIQQKAIVNIGGGAGPTSPVPSPCRAPLALIPVNYFVLHTKMAVFWALLRFRCKPTCCFQVKKDETHASTIWCPFSRCFVRCS